MRGVEGQLGEWEVSWGRGGTRERGAERKNVRRQRGVYGAVTCGVKKSEAKTCTEGEAAAFTYFLEILMFEVVGFRCRVVCSSGVDFTKL